MTVDIDACILRLKWIVDYLEELKEIGSYSSEAILNSRSHYRAVERLEEIIIQASLDLSRHLLKEIHQIQSKDNVDVFVQSARVNILSEDLANRLSESAKFRNVLAHLYGKVDPHRVVQYIPNILSDYSHYVSEIQLYLSSIENMS